ncbi:MAG: tRNA (adenosine(37)-N6)-threonylcarbamoyltransferase complex dimerization subunit type 1 TsaB [Lentisphaeria bacterium]
MIHAALDTSNGTAFAVCKNNKLLFHEFLDGTGRNSDQILVSWLVNSLKSIGLTVNDITNWTLGTGPGSFAGLRCGIAMIKGICLSSNATMRGVASSYALARASKTSQNSSETCGILNDGRHNQVLLSRFQMKDNDWQLVDAPIPLDPDSLLLPEYQCECWATNQQELLPELPEEITAKLQSFQHLPADMLLQNTSVIWPTQSIDMEKSCEPLYVRPAVFVKPHRLAAVAAGE